MEWKIAGSVIVALVVACAVLYVMHLKDAEEVTALKTALASQSALLSETQAELALRDAVIKQRDAALAESERRKEQKDRQYAKLLRDKKDVRDWDSTALPDDVLGLLQAGASGAAGPTCDTDNGGGNP